MTNSCVTNNDSRTNSWWRNDVDLNERPSDYAYNKMNNCYSSDVDVSERMSECAWKRGEGATTN